MKKKLLIKTYCDYCSQSLVIGEILYKNLIRKNKNGLVFHSKCKNKSKEEKVTRSRCSDKTILISCDFCKDKFSITLHNLRKRLLHSRSGSLFCDLECCKENHYEKRRNWNRNTNKQNKEVFIKKEKVKHCSWCGKTAMEQSGGVLVPEKAACWNHSEELKLLMKEKNNNELSDKSYCLIEWVNRHESIGINPLTDWTERFLRGADEESYDSRRNLY